MKLKIPLIFHFNQDLVEFSGLASRVCYRGLLHVLLETPVRAVIQISGTLVQALNWLDPEPLELIRRGLADGKFELMGSTHAQNILIASDPWDNVRQIRLHREILQETFGVQPTAFWNPERCWSQPLASLLADEGCESVTIEDHILERSGAAERLVYGTTHAGRSIRVVRDDERFKHLFNFAAWFGATGGLHRYLDSIAASAPDADPVFAYAEDAEAMGLWGYVVDVAPEQTWDRLAALLVELHARGDVETVLFRDLPEPAGWIETIEDGSAAWMDASLRQPGRPYHEDGYKDWFHFIDTSPKLRRTRERYHLIREALQAAEAGGGRLADLARHTFLTHQYEFGCIGIGGPGTRVWSGAIAALSLLRLAAAGPGIAAEDWNGDGEEEILVCGGDQAVVLTATGGRVLYWADLKTGGLIVGNPSSVVPGPFVRESAPPAPLNYPWAEPAVHDGYAQLDRPVSPPTPLDKFIPAWLWEMDPGPLSLALLGDRIHNGTRTTLSAHQGAFLDEITCNGVPWNPDRAFTRSGLSFTHRGPDGLELVKTFSLLPGGLEMHYRFSGRCAGPLLLHVTAEISGDYAENLRKGRAALSGFLEDGAAGVRTAGGETIRLASTHPGGTFSHHESFHAVTLAYELGFERLGSEPFELTLALTRSM